MGSVTGIPQLADTVEQYGFLVVFAVVCLSIMATAIYMFIKRWESNNKAQSEAQAQKSKVEIELMQKRTNAEIEQSAKMFNLVTEVQTSQIAQMQSIADVINLLKDEIRESKESISDNNERLSSLNVHVKTMMSNYDKVLETNQEIFDYIKLSQNNDAEIIAKLDMVITLLNSIELKDYVKNKEV